MNTPDAADGRVQSWFDGELAVDRDDVTFRSVDDFAIDTLYFSTFFGGSGQNDKGKVRKDTNATASSSEMAAFFECKYTYEF